MSVMTKDFETMTAAHAYETYGWGLALKCSTIVFRRRVNDTVIWVGLSDETVRPYYCEIECNGLVNSSDGRTPYDAMLDALLTSVVRRSVREMWDEPMEQGLKCCCEDVVNAMAQYAFGVYAYGYEHLDELFPNSAKGIPITDAEWQLHDDLMGNAIEFMRNESDAYGIEFVDVWGIEFVDVWE